MKAFIHRIAPGNVDKLQEALNSDVIITGWASARGLLKPELDWLAFREILHLEYYSTDSNYRRAGLAAGNMLRFVREMEVGDLVVVPGPSNFYVAKITGPAWFDEQKIPEDSAYRRPVEWLNSKRPISRTAARAPLISRLKIQGTSAVATDLLIDIEECLELAAGGQFPTFREELKNSLITAALGNIRKGRLDDYRFEALIKEVMIRQGAVNCDIIARNRDMGVDLIATFLVAGTLEQRVGVQVKHWYRDELPAGPEDIEQLVKGLKAEGLTLGMFVSSGTFTEEAQKAATSKYDEHGFSIELVDGHRLAGFLVDLGFSRKWLGAS
jgi:predicted Mrr-cat superfamily restriction endonuclease